MESERYEINAQVIDETIDGETIIINLASGNYYSLNASGAVAWDALRRPSTADELATYLTTRFDGPADDIRSGAHDIIASLRDEQLIAPSTRHVDIDPPTPNGDRAPWSRPVLGKYTDMQDLILLDPVHEVQQDRGWPHHPGAAPSGA